MPNVLGFKIEFDGFQQGLQEVDDFTRKIEQAEQALRDFSRTKAEVDQVQQQFKQANDQLLKVQTTLEKLKSASSKAFDPKLIQKATEQFKQQEQEVDDLGKRIRELNQALRKGPVDGAEAYAKVIVELGKLKANMKEATDEVRKQQRAFQAQKFNEGSYRQLNFQLGELRAKYRDLSEADRKGDIGKNLLKQINKLDTEVKKVDKSLGIYVRNVGNYRDALRGLGSAITQIGAVAGIGLGIQELVEENAKLSDSLADVRKTTGLSEQSLTGYNDVVKELEERLRGIDTRTSLGDLLDISRVGGQLGVVTDLVNGFNEAAEAGDQVRAAFLLEEAGNELEGFTQAVDKITVALGDELAGGADDVAGALGRIVNNLSDAKAIANVEGTGTALLAVGSAINQLASEGAGRAQNIVDITTRVAGIADAAGVSTPQVIGLASAIDELGLAPEAASTSIQGLFTQIASNTETFAEFTGQPLEQFTELVNTDLNAAFIQILDATSNNSESFTEFTGILEGLGITGARSIQTFAKLAQNTDLLRTRQASANQQFNLSKAELEASGSIAEEFAVKNENLAAEIEKLRNQVINLVTGSGIQEFLQTGVRLTSRFLALLVEAPQFIAQNRAAFIALALALAAFNAQQIAAAANNIRRLATEKLLPAIIRTTTIAQRGLNTALTANPIGIVVGLLFLLVGAFVNAYRNVDGFRERVNNAWATVLRFYEGNLLVRLVLFQIIEPIKAAIFLFKNFSAVVAGARAAIGQFVTNTTNRFKGFIASVQILGLEVKRAFTFGSENVAAVDNQIAELRAKKEEFSKAGTTVAEAYQGAFDKATEEAQAARKAKELKEAREKVQLANQGLPTGAGDGDGGAGGGTGSGAAARERREQEARVKAREEATKKIAKLEAELIEDETQRAAELARLGLQEKIAGLQGDPEQINRQAALSAQATINGLNGTFDQARQAAIGKAEEAVQALGESRGLLPSVDQLQREADAISDVLATNTASLFDQQEASARQIAQEQIAGLTGDPETIAAETERINAALQDQIQQIAAARSAAADQLAIEEETRQAQLREIQLRSLEQQLEQEQQASQERLARRIEAINQRLEAEQITTDEAKALREEAEADEQELQLEAEENFYQQRLALAEDNQQALLEISAERVQQELNQEKRKNQELIREAKATERAQRAIYSAQLSLAGDLVSGISDLLSQDEKNRKKYGAALKILSLAEVGINLIREISGIRAGNSRYGEPAATIITAAKTASAIIKAGVATVKIRNTEFEEGVAIATEGTGEPSNLAVGPNGLRTVGPGNVPTEGMITGPRHTNDGVPIVDRHGNLMEVEGGEYRLKNGPITYIINRRSTQKHRAELDSLRGNPNRYDPIKHIRASRINAHRSWGVAFQDGGRIPTGSFNQDSATTGTLAVASIAPPISNQVQLSEATQVQEKATEAMLASVRRLEAANEATNSRIDRITVLARPDDIVKAYEEETEIKETGL